MPANTAPPTKDTARATPRALRRAGAAGVVEARLVPGDDAATAATRPGRLASALWLMHRRNAHRHRLFHWDSSIWGGAGSGRVAAADHASCRSPISCERALTVANNVAVDVTACLGPPSAAISIAHQIAAKVR